MISKCANPGCEAQFLFFGQGKLVVTRRPAKSTSEARVEFFWLCADCARCMDLHITLDGEMTVVRESPKLEAA